MNRTPAEILGMYRERGHPGQAQKDPLYEDKKKPLTLREKITHEKKVVKTPHI